MSCQQEYCNLDFILGEALGREMSKMSRIWTGERYEERGERDVFQIYGTHRQSDKLD